MLYKKLRTYTIIFSIILHLLLLLSYRSLSEILTFKSSASEPGEQEKRIVFEFDEPKEIIETPDDANQEPPTEKTNLVSDKNARARDQYSQKDKAPGAPYSQGDMDIKNIFKNAPELENEQNNQPTIKPEENFTNQQTKKSHNPYQQPKFSRQALLGKNNQQKSQHKFNRPTYKNEEFNAEELGGLSFNTYAWDFAPYMLKMKHKIERHNFPPPAFTHMGMVEGEFLVRFTVLPNGDVKDIKILKENGHETLKETCLNAVKNSAPFDPLPADFPENFLTVTALFSYNIMR